MVVSVTFPAMPSARIRNVAFAVPEAIVRPATEMDAVAFCDLHFQLSVAAECDLKSSGHVETH